MSQTAFTDDQFEALYPEGVDAHYWSLARTSIIIDFLRGLNIGEKRMLEIGCGRGIVLRALRAAEFDCYGVDLAKLSPSKDIEALVQYGASFESIDPSILHSTEVVLLFDVIEHIEDEKSFLKQLKRTFPRLTHVVVTVPARNEIWSNFDIYNGHFRRYSRVLLQTVARETGFSLERSSYFFHLLYIPAFIFSLFNITRGTVVHPPQGILTQLHAVVAHYFKIEYSVIPKGVVGTSIIGVLTPVKNTDV